MWNLNFNYSIRWRTKAVEKQQELHLSLLRWIKIPKWSKSHGYQLFKKYNSSIANSFNFMQHLKYFCKDQKQIKKRIQAQPPVNICRNSVQKIGILSIPFHYLKFFIFSITISLPSPKIWWWSCKFELRIPLVPNRTLSGLLLYAKTNSCTVLHRTGTTDVRVIPSPLVLKVCP